MKTWFALVTAAALAGAIGYRWVSNVRLARARVGPAVIEERVIVQGVIEPVEGVAKVRARVEGRVQRVRVHPGDEVNAGDLLAEIETDTLATEVLRRDAQRLEAEEGARAVAEGGRPEERAIAEANAKVAELEVGLAMSRMERLRKLKKAGALADEELERAENNLEIAQAKLSAARAHLAMLQGARAAEVRAATARASAARFAVDAAAHEATRGRITAPIAGVVLQRFVDPGDTITVGTETFWIADTRRLHVRIEIPDVEATRVELGMKVSLTPPGGGLAVATGTVARLGPQLERRTIGAEDQRTRVDARMRRGHVAIDAVSSVSSQRLVIGQRVEAVIMLGRRDLENTLPRSAVQIVDGRAVVRTASGLFMKTVPIELGLADAENVEVRGLAAGAEVVAGR